MISPSKSRLLLALATLASFMLFLSLSNLQVSWSVMFASSDAQTYFDAAQYFRGGPVKYGLEIRPFFYPLIVLGCLKTGGIWLLWIVQLLMWAVAVQLIFAAIVRSTKHPALAWAGAMAVLSNYSLLALTYSALTEVTAVLGFAVLGYYVLVKRQRQNSISYGAGVVLIFALLVTVKPVFSISLYAVVAGFLLAFRKELVNSVRPWLLLVAALVPFFIQLLIVRVNFGSWKVSAISNITLNEYLYAQGIAKIEGADYSAIKDTVFLHEAQRTEYIFRHFGTYRAVFLQNLDDNLNGEPTFLKYPPGHESPKLADYMLTWNRYAKKAHLLFFCLSCIFAVYLSVKRKLRLYLPLLSLYALVFYYIFVTGISAYQGDRLVLSSIGLWPTVYLLLGCAIFTESRREINRL